MESKADHDQLTPIFFFSTIIIFFFFFFFFFKSSKKQKRRLPPSPLTLPVLGNLHQLGRLPHRSLRALSEKHGPLMLLRLGQVPAIVVSSAELAQEVMKTQDINFASRPQLSITKRLLYNGRDVGFAPYGEYWRQIRRICVLHLLSLKQVQTFRNVRDDEVKLMLSKIKGSDAFNNQGRMPVNLIEIIYPLTNNVVCRAAFGRTYSNEEGGEKIREMLRELEKLIGSFSVGDHISWLSWVDGVSGLNKRVEKNFKELDGFLEKVIDDHLKIINPSSSSSSDEKTSIRANNFIDVLLSLDEQQLEDGGRDTGFSLNRESIKALILDVVAAGTDTTVTAIEWTMAELMMHPSMLSKAQEEVRRVVGSKGHVEEEEDLHELHYLKAAIKESLRLHPPVPLLIMRESIKESVLNGYYIPAKTRVIVNAWAISRDPKTWPGRPEEFLPERFMEINNNGNLDFKGQDFRYIPFGSGRRGCPGILFATSIIEYVLANLLYHFDWELVTDKKATMEELLADEEPGLTIHIKSGLNLIATPRSG